MILPIYYPFGLPLSIPPYDPTIRSFSNVFIGNSSCGRNRKGDWIPTPLSTRTSCMGITGRIIVV
ncbi:MAG: hypothetical protein L3J17_10645 [Candidatus Jettenia sp.]|nr:MAG: hypothetical protein L3J17_10645 [Candidatus Jettenia sp.]